MVKIINIIILSLLSFVVHAKDLGVLGETFNINEADLVEVIKARLEQFSKSGALDAFNRRLQSQAKASINKPRGVALPRATKNNTHYYDPSIVVGADLTDHRGIVFYKKGTKVNPLNLVSLQEAMVFFDGEDKTQVKWVEEKFITTTDKLILTNGSPIDLSNKWDKAVFFDQQALLIKKLKIKALPAVVTQQKNKLKVDTVCLEK